MIPIGGVSNACSIFKSKKSVYFIDGSGLDLPPGNLGPPKGGTNCETGVKQPFKRFRAEKKREGENGNPYYFLKFYKRPFYECQAPKMADGLYHEQLLQYEGDFLMPPGGKPFPGRSVPHLEP